MTGISIEEQIMCVKREIRLRESAYPRWVAKGTLRQADADRELNTMRAVLATLEQQEKNQASLFPV